VWTGSTTPRESSSGLRRWPAPRRHPWYRERLTMVQIAAPSRTRIPSYADLRRRVEETVERNQPVIKLSIGAHRLIDRSGSPEVNQWYRADVASSLRSTMDEPRCQSSLRPRRRRWSARPEQVHGAAVELRDALLINPYDVVGVARPSMPA